MPTAKKPKDLISNHTNLKLESNFSPTKSRYEENFVHVSSNENDLNKIHQFLEKKPTMVIMNREDYISKAEIQLSDPKFYQETQVDLTKTHRDLIIKVIDKRHHNFQGHKDWM